MKISTDSCVCTCVRVRVCVCACCCCCSACARTGHQAQLEEQTSIAIQNVETVHQSHFVNRRKQSEEPRVLLARVLRWPLPLQLQSEWACRHRYGQPAMLPAKSLCRSSWVYLPNLTTRCRQQGNHTDVVEGVHTAVFSFNLLLY